jgi:hypothetical protein
MKPFLAKRYAKRKLHTGNQSVQFDEEREVGRPLFYSTIRVHLRFFSEVRGYHIGTAPENLLNTVYKNSGAP